MEGWNPVLHRKLRCFMKAYWMEDAQLDVFHLYVYHSFASIYSLSTFIYN